jgi:hypothetical protein
MNEIKPFSIRLPKTLWAFLKKKSIEQERAMNEIIIDCIKRYRKQENALDR